MSASAALTARRLGADTVVYGAAMVVDRMLGLILLPILTSAFSKEVYGAWSQILAAYALLSNFLLLGCYHSIMRYLPARPDWERSRVFHGMLVMIFVACSIFLLAAHVAPRLFSEVLFAEDTFESTIASLSVFVVSECLFEFVVVAFLRVERRVRLCAVYQTLKNLLRLGVLTYGARGGASLADLLDNLAIANGLFVLSGYLFHVVPALGIMAIRGLSWAYWKGLICFSLPIVATTTLGWANAFLNRFLIVHQLGLDDLGVFSVNYSIASIASLAALAMTFTLVPHLNTAWNQGDKEGARHLLEVGISQYLLAAVPLAVGTAIFYVPLLGLLAPTDYAGSPILIWSLAAFMLLYGLEQIATFATLLKNSHFSVLTRGISLAANVIGCLLLLRPLGIDAAGLAAVVALLLTIAIGLHQMNGMLDFRFPWPAVIRLVLPSAIMAVVGSVLMRWWGTGLLALVAAGLVSSASFILIEMLSKGSLIRAWRTGAWRASR